MHRRTAATLFAVVTTACASGGPPASNPSQPAAAAASPARPPADPSRIALTASTGRYRVESQAWSRQEMMGQSQEASVNTMMVVSLGLTADAANLAGTFRIDSVTSTSTNPMVASMSAAQGRTIRGLFATSGRAISVAADSADAIGAQIAEQFRDFLPSLPTGTISAGVTWTDTVTSASNMGEIRVQSRSLRQHQVVGWEDREGQRVLRIRTNGTYTVTGSGTVQGSDLTLDGSGVASAERLITAAGIYLGSTGRDSANITVTVPSASMDIPVRQTRQTTITRLP